MLSDIKIGNTEHKATEVGGFIYFAFPLRPIQHNIYSLSPEGGILKKS
jgi:hypothetical protein